MKSVLFALRPRLSSGARSFVTTVGSSITVNGHVCKENVVGMSPEGLILVILTTSALTGTTVAKAVSKGLGALESLWKQGWAGYKNFPHSFPHLQGVHVNHHSWHESGPVPMGLPVEGILERKDHPYHKFVKMLTQSKSPIATHLVQGSRLVKAAAKPVIHVFRHDRQYGQKGGTQAQASTQPAISPITLTSPPVNVAQMDSLSNYLLPDANYMLHQQSAIVPQGAVLFPMADFASPDTDPLSGTMMLMSPLNAAESQEHYPVTSDGFLSLPTQMTQSENTGANHDVTALMMQMDPLPVYAPITPMEPHRPLSIRDENLFGQPEVYEDDVTDDMESSSSTPKSSTLSQRPVDARASEVVNATQSPAGVTSDSTDDLEADEDRQQERET